MPPRVQLPHLLIPARVERTDFAPVTRPIDTPQRTARQQRFLHANKLSGELESAVQHRIELIQSLRIPDNEITPGVCLELQGSTTNPQDFDIFENRGSPNHPVELLNVRIDDGHLRATIFVPESRLNFLRKKIENYGDMKRDPNGTKGSTISMDSVEAVKLADLHSFWLEHTPLPTDLTQDYTWEVWLRKGAADALRNRQTQLGIRISAHSIKFHETEICLMTCSLQTLSKLQIAAKPLSAFRYREQAPGFFTGLEPTEQAGWSENLELRTNHASDNAPAVCVLDTGVRRTHQLLSSSLSERDHDSYEPSWGVDDTSSSGHGTEMAGLALYGDLTELLANSDSVNLKHRLESIKILPASGQNPEELYGWITQESAARAKINSPERQRIFCLAVTSPSLNVTGKPTAWSATIDKLSMGVGSDLAINDADKKLFVISVGNIRDDLKHDEYSSRNDLEPIESPAQAWNALSVGGVTRKAFSEDATLDGWSLIAEPGDISPTSRTSVSWEDKDWPIKPDIVLEGGNCLSDGTLLTHDPDLAVLTTGRDSPLVYTCETSAATAQAARMAAILQADYPNYWPETLRGLLAHGARWESPMYRGQRINQLNATDKANLLRRFGYGIPDLNLARYSASNRACLIVQQEIQPFVRDDGDPTASYMDMNIHTLPWPSELLREHSLTKIHLRVTLSYFIEPNPAERLPTQKYSYASHGLRFELQKPNETVSELRQRLNSKERPKGFESSRASNNWLLGPQTRNKGSLVSDVWSGTAAELAEQSTLLIRPEGGWWKYRKHLNRGSQKARYALIVSLESESQELDVYTPIHNAIRTTTQISI
jgi:hypothetical protein